MRKFHRFSKFLFVIGLAFLTGCAQTSSPSDESISDIRNIRQPDDQVYSSGQPTEAQFRELAAAGVEHIINLRPASEQPDFDEAALVQALGMSYHAIPVAGIADVTSANAASLDQLLATLEGPVLVHCASGNRVGALRAMTAADNGMTIDEALSDGENWGLTGMAPAVRQVLEK